MHRMTFIYSCCGSYCSCCGSFCTYCSHRAKHNTFFTFYALIIVYNRCIIAGLFNCTDRAYPYCRAWMVLRTSFLINGYLHLAHSFLNTYHFIPPWGILLLYASAKDLSTWIFILFSSLLYPPDRSPVPEVLKQRT